MDMAPLDPYSRKVAEKILAAMPELAAYAGLDNVAGQPGCLLVELPAINPKAMTGLFLTTANEEITVGWDRWHTHCPLCPLTSAFDDEVEQAVALLKAILSDRLVICVTMNRDNWHGSIYGTPDEIDAALAQEPALQAGSRKYVLSWRGTEDREITAP